MPALFLLVIITKSVISQNACVWGRDDHVNDVINGAFIFQGSFNGAPWYKKQYGTNIRYMFLYNGYYVISQEEPNNNSPIRYAQCATTSLNPWDCGLNKWGVWDGNDFTIDPHVYCAMGACPEWECDAIITDIQYEGCDDIFPVKIGSNAWSNLNGDRFFYFNYIGFSWACDESLTYSTSEYPSNLLAYSEKTWIDTTKGSTVSIYFDAPFNQIQQIQCVQNPTSEPTNLPTLSPSQHPSHFPTTNPTKFPSNQPTKFPTLSPSQHPSELPTINPTRLPSIQPTDIPVFQSTNHQTATLTKLLLRSSETHDESTTLRSNEVTSETMDKENVYLIVIGGPIALCVCALGLIVCIISARQNNSDEDEANTSSDDSISELPQQQIEVNNNHDLSEDKKEENEMKGTQDVIKIQCVSSKRTKEVIQIQCGQDDDDEDGSSEGMYFNEGNGVEPTSTTTKQTHAAHAQQEVDGEVNITAGSIINTKKVHVSAVMTKQQK